MTEPQITYRAEGKEMGLVFLFKYDLNGDLREFKIESGTLNQSQVKWLYNPNNFPATESLMWSKWIKDPKYKKVFQVEKFKADLSFESIWELWDLKIKMQAAIKSWNKLNEAQKIKCFIKHRYYEAHLSKTGQSKAHLSTWINGLRFDDEY
jgi:hypothetical protein